MTLAAGLTAILVTGLMKILMEIFGAALEQDGFVFLLPVAMFNWFRFGAFGFEPYRSARTK